MVDREPELLIDGPSVRRAQVTARRGGWKRVRSTSGTRGRCPSSVLRRACRSGRAFGDSVASGKGCLDDEMEVVAGAAEESVGLARFDYQHVSRTESHRPTTDHGDALPSRHQVDLIHLIVPVRIIHTSISPAHGDRHPRVPRTDEPALASARHRRRATMNHSRIVTGVGEASTQQAPVGTRATRCTLCADSGRVARPARSAAESRVPRAVRQSRASRAQCGRVARPARSAAESRVPRAVRQSHASRAQCGRVTRPARSAAESRVPRAVRQSRASRAQCRHERAFTRPAHERTFPPLDRYGPTVTDKPLQDGWVRRLLPCRRHAQGGLPPTRRPRRHRSHDCRRAK